MLKEARRRFRGVAGASIVALPALLGACGERGTPAAPAASTADFIVADYLNDPAALRRGRDLFLGSCVSFCHNLIGEQPAPADTLFLFDCQWTHIERNADNEGIFRIIKQGIPGTRMVGFGENFPAGDSDVWSIIAHIRQNQGDCGED